MNAPRRSLLVCTNGAPEGLPALEYGAWLAGLLQLPVTLLGIVEDAARATVVEQALHAAQTRLETAGIPHTVKISAGRVSEIVCAEARPEQHLVVIGPLGQPRWRRWLRGRSVRRLMPTIHAPFIHVPAARLRLAHVLVCTGALDYAVNAECWALYLARLAGARMTVLHVAEAVHYRYPTANQLEIHWRDLLKTDIPQARHLRTFLEQARAAGVEATLQVRQGTVVREIIAAAREIECDLVVMGSKQSARSLRSRYLPDVTAEALEVLALPVLSVQAGQECVFDE